MSVYTDNGYKNRQEYLESLADEYGIDFIKVCELALMLGASEDFDGLLTSIEDYIDWLPEVEQ